MPTKDKLKTISTTKERENKKVKLCLEYNTEHRSISLAVAAKRIHRVAETSAGVAGAFERVAETSKQMATGSQ